MSTEDKDSPGKYSPSEWEQIEASASFGNLPDDQVLFLYRHRVWADYARDEFVEGSGVVIINGCSRSRRPMNSGHRFSHDTRRMLN